MSSRYGTPGERWQLGSEAGELPSWSSPGQRWAVLTAWNPLGEPQDRALNEAAQARLQADLSGWTVLEGLNGEGEWAEPSLIVLNLPLCRAAELGERHRQAAVLWGVGRRAALVWCSPLRVERFWLRALERRPAGDRYTSLP